MAFGFGLLRIPLIGKFSIQHSKFLPVQYSLIFAVHQSCSMDLYTIITLLIVLSALFGYANTRFLKLPDTIGLMVISLIFTLGILAAGVFIPALPEMARGFITQIDFNEVLLDVMLSFLLFAGALHTDFNKLKEVRWPILLFATVGVLISTFLIGGMSFALFQLLGLDVPFIYCLLFGSLISPTDPIAVLSLLKQANVPKKLESKIVGESLFNDGIGVVVFITIFHIAQVNEPHINWGEIGFLFLEEVAGGIGLGLLLGYLAWYFMRTVDNFAVEIMLSLAVVMGGTSLAVYFHFSGPLAMVVAGLFIGTDRFRTTSMSETTELYIDKFWEVLDILLNALLFVLIGLEIIILTLNGQFILAGILSIPICLAARFIAISIPIRWLSKRLEFVPNTALVMTWGGLRGGISIALALSLEHFMARDLLITVTYVVVLFSIIGQGLTISPLVKKLEKG